MEKKETTQTDKNKKQYTFVFNKKNDKDIVDKIDYVKNKERYIKNLIRLDLMQNLVTNISRGLFDMQEPNIRLGLPIEDTNKALLSITSPLENAIYVRDELFRDRMLPVIVGARETRRMYQFNLIYNEEQELALDVEDDIDKWAEELESGNGINVNNFGKRLVDIDANAFANTFVELAFGEKPNYGLMSTDLVNKITEKEKKFKEIYADILRDF